MVEIENENGLEITINKKTFFRNCENIIIHLKSFKYGCRIRHCKNVKIINEDGFCFGTFDYILTFDIRPFIYQYALKPKIKMEGCKGSIIFLPYIEFNVYRCFLNIDIIGNLNINRGFSDNVFFTKNKNYLSLLKGDTDRKIIFNKEVFIIK